MVICKSAHFIVLLIAFVFTAFIPARAIAAEESITLTTYYPSPYGVYSEMRLYPKASAACDSTQRGLMYYDDDEDRFKFCAGTPADWIPIGGSLWTLAGGARIYPNDLAWNVGIGTGSPGTKLSVRVDGNGANAVLRLSSILSSWTAGYGPRLLFHGGSDDRVFGEIGSFLQNTGTGANAYMTFSTRDSEVLGERMRINSAGNVGIGTTGPLERLHIVSGDDNGTRILVQNTDAGATTWDINSAGSTSGIGVGNFAINEYGVNPRLVIQKTTGNVCMGCGSPSASNTRLYLYGSMATLLTLHNSVNNQGAAIELREDGGGDWILKAIQANGGFKIRDSVAAQDRVTILNDGNVGIGTTGPTQKLDVDGKARFRSGIQMGGAQLSAFCSGVPPISCNNITPLGTRYDFCALSMIGGRDGVECEISDLGGGQWRLDGRNSFSTSVKCTMRCFNYY